MRPCCFVVSPVPSIGTPLRGVLQYIGGVPCYVADDKGMLMDAATPCILLAPDLFGLSPHAMRVADEMNRRSNRPVVIVDYFRGSALPTSVMERMAMWTMPALPGAPPKPCLEKVLSFGHGVGVFVSILPTLLPFLWRHMGKVGKAAKLSLIESIATELQVGGGQGGGGKPSSSLSSSSPSSSSSSSSCHSRKLGLVGYCYGGYAALYFNSLPTTSSSSLFASTVVAHGKVALSNITALRRPILFVCAENDFAFPEKRICQAEIMARTRLDYSEDRFRFRRYRGTYHGFAIRGDERNPVIEKAKGEALDEIIDFFKTTL